MNRSANFSECSTPEVIAAEDIRQVRRSSASDCENRIALFVALLLSNISYLILSFSWVETGRGTVSLTPEASGFILLTVLIIAKFVSRLGSLFRKLPFLFLLLYSGWFLAGEIMREAISMRLVPALVAPPLVFAAGYLIVRTLMRTSATYLALLLMGVIAVWDGLLGWLILSDAMSYDVLAGVDRERMGIAGSLTSTELGIYLGLHFSYLLYILLGPVAKAAKLVAALLLATNLALLYMTFPLSAVAGYVLSFGLFLFTVLRWRVSLKTGFYVLCFASLLGSLFTTTFGDAVVTKFENIAEGGGRAVIYEDLIVVAKGNPIWGIGKGRYVDSNNLGPDGGGFYPHSNLLGAAAEGGIPAAVFYALFIISVIVTLLTGAFRLPYGSARCLITLALSVFVYQQFRGLVQDTVGLKELYLWAGVGTGLAAIAAPRRVRVKASNAQGFNV